MMEKGSSTSDHVVVEQNCKQQSVFTVAPHDENCESVSKYALDNKRFRPVRNFNKKNLPLYVRRYSKKALSRRYKLAAKEKNYIHLRYPNVKPSDMIFEKVVAQPDGTCCGIYAAAFATTVALGGNPCNEKYCKDVKCMRRHFMEIVESNKLIAFP